MKTRALHGFPGPKSTVLWLLRLAYKKNYTLLNLTHDLQKTFGDLIRVKIPLNPAMLLVADPDVIGRVLIGSEKISTKGKIYKRMEIFLGQGLFTSVGEKWRVTRRLLNPMFHPSQMERISQLIADETRKMGNRWEKNLARTDIVDLSDEITKLSFSIISQVMFTTDLSEKAQNLRQMVGDVQELASVFQFSPFIFPRWLPTPFNRRLRKVIDLIDSMTHQLIQEHRSQPELYNDLLTVLLNTRDPETGKGLSDIQLRDEIITMMIAGHETTASTLSMGLEALSREPQVVQKMRAEFQRESTGSPLDFRKFTYNAHVCLEILRLYPAIWGMERVMMEDVVIKDHQLKKGDNLLLMQSLTHRHPKYWPDADTFDPDRFSSEKSGNRHPFAFFPFGGGVRSCIGAGMAKAEIEIANWQILSRFDLIPIEGFHYTPMARVTMSAEPNIRVRIAKIKG